MKVTIISKEYPPRVYGGAGVHVKFLTRELAKKSRLIRLPLNRSEKLCRIGATQEILRQELGRMPTEDEIGDRLEMGPDEIRDSG